MSKRTFSRGRGPIARLAIVAAPRQRAAIWLGWGPIALLAIVVALACGCKKSNPTPSASAAAASNTFVRVHWMGKKWLAQDKTAASFMAIWDLPESARLEAQTLDKLALAMAGEKQSRVQSPESKVGTENSNAPSPYPLPQGEGRTNSGSLQSSNPRTLEQSNNPSLAVSDNPSIQHSINPALQYSNAPLTGSAALLRPLLDDLVQEESYLEVRRPVAEHSNTPALPYPNTPTLQHSNAPTPLTDFALAIRLSDDRAKLWAASLAEIAKNPASSTQSPSPFPLLPSHLTLHTSAHGWTVVGPEHGAAAADLLARIERVHTPVVAPRKDYWLSAEVNLGRIEIPILQDFAIPAGLPRISLELTGDGKDVRTHAELEFPRPLPIQLEPWNIPTNMVHGPLVGFMAIRGIRPWLEALKPWNDLKLGTAPNQACFWAQAAAPFHFMALPSIDASNQVNTLAEFVLREVNPILLSKKPRLGTFERKPDSTRLSWHGIPWFSPNLDSVTSEGKPFIVGGFSSNLLTNRPVPSEMLQQVYSQTNMVWYDWEITQPSAEGLMQVSQMARVVFGLPRLTGTASLFWSRAVLHKLGNSVTAIRVAGPSRLFFVRSSSMGLTGAEINVLVDWLESPDFPRGLHTFLAPPPPPIPLGHSTNAVPARPVR